MENFSPKWALLGISLDFAVKENIIHPNNTLSGMDRENFLGVWDTKIIIMDICVIESGI